MKTFADKLKKARAELDISQSALAKKVGVSTRMILAYETTNTRPRPATLIKLARALNLSPDYLKDDVIDTAETVIESQNQKENIKENIKEIKNQFGVKRLKGFEALLQLNIAIFTDDFLPQESKDIYFESLMKAYLESKEESRKLSTTNDHDNDQQT